MGVSGLLTTLKEIQEPTTLERYRGKTLAIDTYGWLHRALVSCSQDLCQDKPTKRYVTSVMNKVGMLKHFDITPYFVFDGGILPTKLETLKGRRQKREESLNKANEYIKANKTKLAHKEFMKAACVTPQMAKSIMNELDKLDIKYVVAPYEADPQMVYLEKRGIVDGILSEDSDLLIFGCNKLITKLKDDGSCIEICRQNFDKVKQVPYLSNFSDEQLRLVVMLSGCDYTKGVPGVGLKTAFTLVKKFQTLSKVLVNLKFENKPVPLDFEEEICRADLAFQYQKVFNPDTQTLATLNEYPEDLSVGLDIVELCCGETIDAEIMKRVCNGMAHPTNHSTLVSREEHLFSSQYRKVPVNKAGTPQRSNSTSSINTNPKRSILDLLQSKKVSIPPLKTVMAESNLNIEKKVNPQLGKTTESTKVRLHISSAGLKRNLSPTTKKIQNINYSDSNQRGSPVHSKFFKNCLKQKSLPTTNFDMSFDTRRVESKPLILEEGGITDNDDFEFSEDEELEQMFQSDAKSQIAMNSTSSLSTVESQVKQEEYFEFDAQDDEIEESPVRKRTDRLATFVSLRENFSYKEGSSQAFPPTASVQLSLNKDTLRSKITFKKDQNSNDSGPEKTSEDEAIDEDDSQILVDVHDSPPSVKSGKHKQSVSTSEVLLTPANLGLSLKFATKAISYSTESQISIEDDIISEEESVKPATMGVNLRRFAFRG